MLKKSTTSKIKSLIYPMAFILIIVLSAVYKLVFRGNGILSVHAFKSGRNALITEVSSSGSIPEGADPSVTTASSSVLQTESVQLISVYICGEVNSPGIYKAPRGVLLNDIIGDAGGLTPEASVPGASGVFPADHRSRAERRDNS